MACVLNSGNITFVDYRENEVAMALHVMEEIVYCMSPQLALELAAQLEAKAREVMEKQRVALWKFDQQKAGGAH